MNALKSILTDLIEIIYPRLCESCDCVLLSHEHHICNKCLVEIPRTRFHDDSENQINKLFWGRSRISNASSFFYFNKGSKFRKLIHKLKYSGINEIGYELGRQFGSELSEDKGFRDVDIIIPIPLHPKKEKKRGYNQSKSIADGLSQSMKKPVNSESVKRKVFTSTQTKKSRIERWENVQDVFSVIDKKTLEGKHILLVDDVITTGATVEACAEKILQIKNTKVSIATLAVA